MLPPTVHIRWLFPGVFQHNVHLSTYPNVWGGGATHTSVRATRSSFALPVSPVKKAPTYMHVQKNQTVRDRRKKNRLIYYELGCVMKMAMTAILNYESDYLLDYLWIIIVIIILINM